MAARLARNLSRSMWSAHSTKAAKAEEGGSPGRKSSCTIQTPLPSPAACMAPPQARPPGKTWGRPQLIPREPAPGFPRSLSGSHPCQPYHRPGVSPNAGWCLTLLSHSRTAFCSQAGVQDLRCRSALSRAHHHRAPPRSGWQATGPGRGRGRQRLRPEDTGAAVIHCLGSASFVVNRDR